MFVDYFTSIFEFSLGQVITIYCFSCSSLLSGHCCLSVRGEGVVFDAVAFAPEDVCT